jgi:hypothetical protein
MIDDGIGFQRVPPWQPVLDMRIGQHIGGVMRNVGGTEGELRQATRVGSSSGAKEL